ncbi:MAG: hypothetical protein ACLPWF_18665 [Bryobacteraceae bacterium]|jgi:hypothetical protein
MAEEDVVVSINDESDEARKLSEYKPTNVPLSKDEIEQDEARDSQHEGWAPRTTENIGDMTPLPEKRAIP